MKFSDILAAETLAADLHDKLETIRADAAREGCHSSADMEDLLMAESGAQRVLRMLGRLKMSAHLKAANAAIKQAAE
jgi:hypothetical protein